MGKARTIKISINIFNLLPRNVKIIIIAIINEVSKGIVIISADNIIDY